MLPKIVGSEIIGPSHSFHHSTGSKKSGLGVIDEGATPVTVFGPVSSVLGVTRSLGRLGVPVYVIDSDPQTPAFFSTYCYRKVFSNMFPTILEFNEKLVQELLDIGSKIGQKSILIPGNDEGAVLVNDQADALKEWFMFPNQSASLARCLCSKEEMYHLTKRLKIPTAEAFFPQCKQDVLNFAKTARFPIMLKSIHGWHPWSRAIARTERELIKNYDAMENPQEPNLMLQEYIAGEDDSGWIFHGYFNQDSKCLLGFTGKKLRQWPPYHGNTSLGICLKNEAVDKTSKEFMKATGYRGIVDIDYRYDWRDGKYRVLDVNPRIGANFRLFVTDNGMDVARALYLDMTGQPVTIGIFPPGRKWISERLDLSSSIIYHSDGNLPLKQWINSYRGVRELGIFALDDPVPFLHAGALKVADIIRGLSQLNNAGGMRNASATYTRYENSGRPETRHEPRE